MAEIAQEIGCPDCGAPLKVKAGLAIITCEYCGSDVNMAVGAKYFLQHSIIPAKFDKKAMLAEVRSWMKKGFLMPSDLHRKADIEFIELRFLPFFIIHVTAKSNYSGVFTRTGQNIDKKGEFSNEYYWKILGRRGSGFPTKSYEVPAAGKSEFNLSLLSPEARFINSEIDENEAVQKAEMEIKEHQKFLLRDEVDHITELDTQITVHNSEFLHVPIYYIKYGYRGKTYDLIMCGATGQEIKGEIPSMEKKGLMGKLFGT